MAAVPESTPQASTPVWTWHGAARRWLRKRYRLGHGADWQEETCCLPRHSPWKEPWMRMSCMRKPPRNTRATSSRRAQGNPRPFSRRSRLWGGKADGASAAAWPRATPRGGGSWGALLSQPVRPPCPSTVLGPCPSCYGGSQNQPEPWQDLVHVRAEEPALPVVPCRRCHRPPRPGHCRPLSGPAPRW